MPIRGDTIWLRRAIPIDPAKECVQPTDSTQLFKSHGSCLATFYVSTELLALSLSSMAFFLDSNKLSKCRRDGDDYCRMINLVLYIQCLHVPTTLLDLTIQEMHSTSSEEENPM